MHETTVNARAGDAFGQFISRLKRAGSASGALLMLVVLCVVFALGTENFSSGPNLVNIAVQSTILLLLALPMTLIIMTEGLDLSMGAVLTLANVVVATVAVKSGGVGAALLAGLGVGLAFGLINGLLVAKLAIPPFVATLGTLGAAQGLALVVTDGQRLAGVRTRLYLVAVYVLGGLMAGFAALLLAARISSGHPTAAIGMEFDAIAAVAVGGTSFEKGKGWLLGTLIGVLAVGVLRNGLNLLGVTSAVQVSAIGLLVIAALMIDAFRGRHA